ncbi:MAG: hypothetical protein ACREXY_14750, partial [Gammaproteobacteria bacterium]
MLPADYARWQTLLTHTYFDGRADQPIVMFIDRDDIHELGDAGEDAPRSLAMAVRRLVDVGRGASMFADVERLQSSWSRGARAEPPPTLPVLALSVLAASEMRSDSEGARHNYYVRLARSMLPDGSDNDIELLRYNLSQRGAFVRVAGMWRRLHEWLGEQDGAFGTSTIPANPAWSR